MATEDIYVCDTSSLIELKDFLPRSVFVGIWGSVEGLIGEGRLVAPDEVKTELRRGSDDIEQWAQEQGGLFLPVTDGLWARSREVALRYPDLVSEDKQTADADPFLVGAALNIDPGLFGMAVVVTEEHDRPGRTRIPHACQGFGIEYVDLRGMFEREGWRF